MACNTSGARAGAGAHSFRHLQRNCIKNPFSAAAPAPITAVRFVYGRSLYANVVCHPRAFRAGSETGIRSTEVRAHRVRAAPAASATTPGHAAATQRNAPTARQTARTQRHALADETRPRGARGYYPAAAACGMQLAGGSRALPRSSVGSASGWRSSGNVQCTLRERVCLPWPLRFTGHDT